MKIFSIIMFVLSGMALLMTLGLYGFLIDNSLVVNIASDGPIRAWIILLSCLIVQFVGWFLMGRLAGRSSMYVADDIDSK